MDQRDVQWDITGCLRHGNELKKQGKHYDIIIRVNT